MFAGFGRRHADNHAPAVDQGGHRRTAPEICTTGAVRFAARKLSHTAEGQPRAPAYDSGSSGTAHDHALRHVPGPRARTSVRRLRGLTAALISAPKGAAINSQQ